MTEYPTRRSLREAEAARARAAEAAEAAATRDEPRLRSATAPSAANSWVITPENIGRADNTEGIEGLGRVLPEPAPVTAPAEASAPRHHERAHRGHRISPRARMRLLMSAAAAILLAGTAVVAMPADAATIPGGTTVYASQLLADPQSFTVHGNVAKPKLDIDPYGANAPTATDVSKVAPGSNVTFTVGGTTNADWAALVLQDASLPVTKNNLTVMLQWMDSENSPQSWYLRNNPLNNGLGSGGGAGFGSYPDLRTAASYAGEQLDRSLFSGIHDALAADSPVDVSAQAIMASAWATSHYGYGSLWHAVDVPIVAAPASDW